MGMNLTEKTSKSILFFALGISLFLVGSVRQAQAASYGTDFESFMVGEVNAQDGWTSGHGSSSCPVYDVGVVSNTFGYAGFDSKSLRTSRESSTMTAAPRPSPISSCS